MPATAFDALSAKANWDAIEKMLCVPCTGKIVLQYKVDSDDWLRAVFNVIAQPWSVHGSSPRSLRRARPQRTALHAYPLQYVC